MKKSAITEEYATSFPIVDKMYGYIDKHIHQITFSRNIGSIDIGNTCLIVISPLCAKDIVSVINNHLHINYDGKITIQELTKDDIKSDTRYPQIYLGKFVQYLESISLIQIRGVDNSNNIIID